MTMNLGRGSAASCEACGQPYDWQIRPGTARSDVNVLAGPYCSECKKNWWGNQLSDEELKACGHVRRAPTPEVERLRKAVEMMSIGVNHIASVLIGRLGGGFANKYPPTMAHGKVLAALGSGDDYEMWCCWSAAMRSREFSD